MDFEEILSFAIEKEEEAAEYYEQLARQVHSVQMRQILVDFALDERGHKTRLELIRERGHLAPAPERVANLKIADYLIEVEPESEMSYQQALIIAMKREQRSYDLYQHLASALDDEGTRQTLLALAQEEARHKLRLESEYDEAVLTEN